MNKKINITLSGVEFDREQIKELINQINAEISEVDLSVVIRREKSLYHKFLELILRWLE